MSQALLESTVHGEPAVPNELLSFLKQGKKFLIAGHKEPDGDCLGSQLALASALRRMGKETILCSAGPFERSEINKYKNLFLSAPAEKDAKVILLDCSTLGRTGDLASHLEGLPLAVIDHHETKNPADEPLTGAINYVAINAPSTTYLVRKLILALGLELSREEAELLFFGLCTDTGFFRHVDNTGVACFEAAAALIRCGANPKAAFAEINGGKSLESRKRVGHLLLNTESFYDGKMLLSTEELEKTSLFGLHDRDSDSVYQLLQAVAGAEVIVLIRQENAEKCNIGLRSRSIVDVGSIAASLGGGGHKNAAGISLEGTINELKPIIVNAFADSMK